MELVYLACSKNFITELDLSRNTSLQTLYCYENDISALNVSNNPGLIILNAHDNNLAAIDISHNKNLKSLDVSYNSLEALDLTQNTGLEELDCTDNRLTELDLTGNEALTAIKFDNQNPYGLRVIKADSGKYQVVVSSFMNNKITAFNRSNEAIHGTSNKIIVQYDFMPSAVNYYYDTGKGLMNVTYRVSEQSVIIVSNIKPDAVFGAEFNYPLQS